MKKVLLTCMLALSLGVSAQVGPPQATNPNTNNGYGFAQTSGTYVPLSASRTVWQSGTALATDAVSSAVTLPFNFRYNARTYNSIFISNNGFITFGSPTTPSTYTALSTDLTTVGNIFDGAVAGFAVNLKNANTTTSEISYETVGSKFIIQFTDLQGNSASAAQLISFQIQLDSFNNSVSIVYGTCASGIATLTGQVGLKGAESSDVNNRTGTNWTTTAIGTSNSSSCTLGSTGTTTIPASGLTFTFTPGTWLANPTTYATIPFTENFSTWVNGNSTADLPNAGYWRSWPSRGDNSWRASDTTITGFTTSSGWTSVSGGATTATPAVAPTARFHSYNTIGVAGYMDLYVNLSGGGVGNRVIAFDYINTSGTDKLDVLLSTDGGTTFTSLGSSLGVAATWGNRSFTTSSTSSSAIVRLLATGDNGSTDIQVDNLTITVSALPPVCTNISTPANAATAVSATPTITWAAASGATSYLVNLGTTPGGTNVMNGVDVGNVTTYTIPTGTPLNYSTQYYITILPKNDFGTATGCTETSFTTAVIPCPSVVTPLAGAANVALSPTITWSAITGATGYRLTVGTTTGGTDVVNNIDLGNVLSYTFTAPLSVATKYFYKVNAYSGSSVSASCAERNFTTACNTVAAFSENFDTTAANSLPNCWSKVGTTGSVYAQASTVISSPNNLYIYSSSSTDIAMAAMPPLSTLQSGTYRLKFKARSNFTTGGIIQVGYLTNSADQSTFTSLASFTTTSITAIDNFVLNNVTAPAGVTTLAFRHTGSPANSVLIDDVVYELMPLCTDPTAVTVSAVTSSSATIGWTAPATAPANGYEYYYSTSSTAPIASTVASGTSTAVSVSLPGLTPATVYYVWVRSVCSTTEKSIWSTVATFTTACNPITSFPWNENFDTMTTIGNGILPSCWTTTGGFSSSYLFTTQNAASQTYNDPRSAPNYVTIYYPTTAAYLWAPAMTLTAGQSYDFSFYWAGDATSGWVGDVLVNNSPSATGATNLNTFVTQTTTTTNAYTKVTVTFVPATTGSYNFGIKSFSATTAPYYMGFDDFNVQLTPACAEPTSVAVNSITSSSATLSWNAPATVPANGYVYAYSTTNTTPTSGTATTATSIPLSQLTPSTTYYYWVRSVCSATSNSAWVAGSFTTSATPPANDDCVGAVMLTVNPDYACGVTTSGTTVSATASTETAPTCGATGTNDDVWFKFIATNTAHRIVLSNVSGSTDMAMAAYSGSCGSLVQVLCSDPNTMDLTGLIVGQEYKVRVWTYTSTATTTATFNICVGTPPPPPANDNCSGAILLTPGATFAQNPLTATTVGATLTTDATATTACQTTRYADTWYSVVVPASGSITIETATTAGTAVTDTVMGVYTGSCGSLVSVGCNDDILAGTNNFSKVSLTGQTPGQTLLIGVWNYSSSNNGAFQISAYDASLSTSETAQVKNDVTVYPNPFADILNISDVKNVKSVSVIDIAGRLIKTIEKPSSALQLRELKSGMYIVVLNMNDGSKQTIKAIKK